MTTLHAAKAWLPGGWADDVLLTIESGRIRTIETGQPENGVAERADIVLPGLCNAHSHAFQRALCGFAEAASPAGKDNFWSWRERMYALAGLIDPPELCAIAAQAYAEMLAAGFTAVSEFHYLHRNADGSMTGAMRDALFEAAAQTGIRLQYVPVLYERGGFDDRALLNAQSRFGLDLELYIDHVADSADRAANHSAENVSVAIGAHSLRAVRRASLTTLADFAAEKDLSLQLHIAEQKTEVNDCVAATAKRPVAWLLDNADVNARWCLVHATHLEKEECTALAKSGAVVCLCPTTEANLGDGLFALPAFLEQGGAFAIGSDSQISIDPFEELRWLEYGQRLETLSRNVVSRRDGHTGSELYARALAGGAQAAGLKTAGLKSDAAADLLTLDGDAPLLAGHETATVLDAVIFGGHRTPIDRVMVAGVWQVADARHRNGEAVASAYRSTLQQLGPQL